MCFEWEVRTAQSFTGETKQSELYSMWASLKRKHNKNSHLKLMKGGHFKEIC